ncbi:MAG: tripartite tricarboxylate transporter permease [Candidatus Binatia bacterium]
MFEALVQALANILTPVHLAMLVAGVLIGLSLGVIPGIGGVTGLALLLPFTFDMGPVTAFAFLIGMLAVTTTSDTIPSVLFAIPGTVGSQATIIDGHAMARKGEAGRALGAAFTVSALGGLFGALVLTVSIPILKPLVLAFGSPEFFMMAVLGVSMVASLSGSAPMRGIVAGGMGLLLAMVGMDPLLGVERWTFEQVYFWDGIHVVPLSLGLFGMAELADLIVRGTSIASGPVGLLKGRWDGVHDAFRHWWLMLRSSALGVWIGIIPGLGSLVVDWFAYGHAVHTEKNPENFGRGDVRGVIAPESANNAKEGGGLIPTLAFGIPGSTTMALFLGAMMVQGLTPRPEMLTKHLDLIFTIAWSLALANVIGTGICFLLTNRLAWIATIRGQILAPVLLVIMFLAAFMANRHVGDLMLLLSFGAIGWFMKRFGWPRPPLIIGFILGGVVEKYLYISILTYGSSWLTRPGVLVLFLLIIAALVYPAIRQHRAKETSTVEGP